MKLKEIPNTMANMCQLEDIFEITAGEENSRVEQSGPKISEYEAGVIYEAANDSDSQALDKIFNEMAPLQGPSNNASDMKTSSLINTKYLRSNN